jgi:uncharacterized protein (TIGR03067 family)
MLAVDVNASNRGELSGAECPRAQRASTPAIEYHVRIAAAAERRVDRPTTPAATSSKIFRGTAVAILFNLLLSSTLLAPNAVVSTDDASLDQKQMQGTWEVVEGADNGAAGSKNDLAKFSVEVTESRIRFKGPEGVRELLFTLDPSTQPKAMDATPADGPKQGKRLRGIYEVQGDSLKVCLVHLDDKERPDKFESEHGSGRLLFVLKRKAK